MNSIVERLRDYQESWGDSIKRMDCGEFGDNGIMSQIRAEQHATLKEAADLIEQQAERIKELEAWRDSWVKCPEGAAAQRIKELEAKWLDEQKAALTAEAELELANQQIANQQMLSGVDADALAHARSELTALRQRIDDAPIIKYEWVGDGMKPLINREDLL